MILDDLELLSTDYFPTATESLEIKLRLEERRNELCSIDEKIRNLQDQRASVYKSFAATESLMAPIRKIPSEILGEIFVQSIPGFLKEMLEKEKDNIPLDRKQVHPHHMRSVLSTVCRRWKIVMDETPRVWSTISLGGFLHPHYNSAIERCFNRSKSCLLDIYIRPCAWFYDCDVQSVLSVFSIIQRHSQRIRLLIAYLCRQEYPCDFTLTSIFPLDQCTEAPNLQVLAAIGGPGMNEVAGAIRAPNLSHLFLDSDYMIRSFAHDSLLALRRLTISVKVCSSGSYTNVLVICRNLEVLHWTDHCDSQEDPMQPNLSSRQISLPFLKSLHLALEDSVAARPLLERLHAPILESVVYDASPGGHTRRPALEALNLLLSEKLPHLRQLTLNRASMVGSGIGDWFHRFPSVINISIIDCDLDPSFFSMLTSHNHNFPLGGPPIETLYIWSSDFSVSDLMCFVRHHMQPDTYGGSAACLTSVDIVACGELLEEDIEQLDYLQDTYNGTVFYDHEG